VFVPFTAVFIAVLSVRSLRKTCPWHYPWQQVLLVSAGVLIFLLPYTVALSWSYGHFTVGVSGTLNYGFHVDHMPHWVNWQGTGKLVPIHHTTPLLKDQPVFGFATPFHSTYPPYNNMAYWYEGIRPPFSPGMQLNALLRSCIELARVVAQHTFLLCIMAATLIVIIHKPYRSDLYEGMRFGWPIVALAAMGVGVYLLVHVEDRYLAPFCMLAATIPWLPILSGRSRSDPRYVATLLTLYAITGGVDIARANRAAFGAAFRQTDFHEDRDWQIATLLKSYGLNKNDPVAIIDGPEPAYRCSWAYVSGLRIVGEFGGVPWSIAPWDRTRFDPINREPADEDYAQKFWTFSPTQRERVLDAFRPLHPRAVISLWNPAGRAEPGWRPIGHTGAWVYFF
jgi:hypothetical protein